MSTAKDASLQYVDIIQDRLQIELDDSESPVFVPDRVEPAHIISLKDDISDTFKNSIDGMLHEASAQGKELIQGVGFGLIEDFEKFIKVGLLYSNKIVLWDYLWGRILRDVTAYEQHIDHLGEVAKNLVGIRQIIENNGIIILPHPTDWHKPTNTCLSELAEEPDLYTSTNFGLVSALSVCQELQLHPYTLYEHHVYLGGTPEFDKLYNADKVNYAYNLTKLLDEEPFTLIDDLSANAFHQFLKDNPDFFAEFRDTFLISGDKKSEAELKQAFIQKKDKVIAQLKERDKNARNKGISLAAEATTHLAALANIIFGVATGTMTDTLLLTAAASLSAALARLISSNKTKQENNILILGFEKLKKMEGKEA